MSFKVTVLGCGNSTGVPAIGNYWGQCDPNQPKNRRTRSSIHVQGEEGSLVVDTGPDFREQINRENVDHIDAVLYTHQHSDHVNGMDDLRVIRFRNDALVPVYGNGTTMKDLSNRFDYLFTGGDIDLYTQILDPYVFTEDDYGRTLDVKDLSFVPFVQDHGTVETVGYRFGEFAYSVDMLTLNDTAIDALRGVKVWLVDCAGYGHTSNPVHANLETLIALNEKIGAEQVYLTSLTLAADYDTLMNDLPDGFKPAHDGLVLTF